MSEKSAVCVLCGLVYGENSCHIPGINCDPNGINVTHIGRMPVVRQYESEEVTE